MGSGAPVRDFTYGLCSKRIYLRHISLPKKTKNIKVSYEQDVFFGGGPSVFEMIIAEIFVDTRLLSGAGAKNREKKHLS